MKHQTVISKKRGPAPTGKGVPVMVRLQPELLGRIEFWRTHQIDRAYTRPEAIRALVEKALDNHKTAGR
jgi:hypothetical protein